MTRFTGVAFRINDSQVHETGFYGLVTHFVTDGFKIGDEVKIYTKSRGHKWVLRDHWTFGQAARGTEMIDKWLRDGNRSILSTAMKDLFRNPQEYEQAQQNVV
jgi:hypothetical protein